MYSNCFFLFTNTLRFLSSLWRWPLPTARALSSPYSRTDGSWSQSLCAHGRSHSNRPGSSRSCHHCDRIAGRNVPDHTGADGVSTLSAGNRYPHLPWCRPHEHTLLPVLLLRRVSSSAQLWSTHASLLVEDLWLLRLEVCDLCCSKIPVVAFIHITVKNWHTGNIKIRL